MPGCSTAGNLPPSRTPFGVRPSIWRPTA
jgi:hypothetical protein